MKKIKKKILRWLFMPNDILEEAKTIAVRKQEYELAGRIRAFQDGRVYEDEAPRLWGESEIAQSLLKGWKLTN